MVTALDSTCIDVAEDLCTAAFLPPALRGTPCLQKPIDFNALLRLIRHVGIA